MSNHFFSTFPRVPINILGQEIQYTDIYRFIDVDELFLNDYNQYILYEIEDGDRPDQVSFKLYDSSLYAWTFFISEDRLKKGIEQWPLSSTALERKISKEYSKFGACTLLSGISLNVDMENESWVFDLLDENGIEDLMDAIDQGFTLPYTKLSGLDLSHPYLRVKRNASINASTYWAEIEKYDANLWQLWFKNVKDSNFFREDLSDNQISIFLTNPYEIGTDEYTEVEELNMAWLQTAAEEWYPTHHDDFTFTHANIQTEIESKLVLEVGTFYLDAGNAPYSYEEGGRTLRHLTQAPNNLTVTTNREHEEVLNDEKRFIKVVRPESIRAFGDEYDQRVNGS